MGMNDQQPPWGKKKPSSPEEILAAIIQKIKDSFAGEDKPGGDGYSKDPGPSSSSQGPFAGIGKIALIIFAVIVFQVIYSIIIIKKASQKGLI